VGDRAGTGLGGVAGTVRSLRLPAAQRAHHPQRASDRAACARPSGEPLRPAQPPGVQSDGSAQPRQLPGSSSPASDTGAAEEGGAISSAIAAPGADVRATPVATIVSATAQGELSTVPLAGDLPAERHRLPARVTRYWRWRAFYSSCRSWSCWSPRRSFCPGAPGGLAGASSPSSLR
jgi:hypothetical protein